jgi:hypothetical protein
MALPAAKQDRMIKQAGAGQVLGNTARSIVQ